MYYYPVKEKIEKDPFFDKVRKQSEELESQTLNLNAAPSSKHQRITEESKDHRLCYDRDIDRIIHSKSYARYSEKTQVVYLVENDHITQRGLHVQLVSNFARGIGHVLRLNLDLVEAISLGHDTGHPPFGHEGESYLSEISEAHGNGKFAHPWQSCRLFREIEPLNLGLFVYDGFLCHDGGMNGPIIEPNLGKTWDVHFEELELKKANPDKNISPGTLEGCLVKICDTVSYLGKDLEDAITLKLLSRSEIPDTLLGKSNREILHTISRDIIKSSYGKNYIALSKECYEALLILRKFNFTHIYERAEIKVESVRVKRAYQVLFKTLLEDFNENGEKSYLWKEFLENKLEKYKEESSLVQVVVDFISGMTDRFCVRTLEELSVPHLIKL